MKSSVSKPGFRSIFLLAILICIGCAYLVSRRSLRAPWRGVMMEQKGEDQLQFLITQPPSPPPPLPGERGKVHLVPGVPYQRLNFDPHGNDSLVMIHTQKTGGSDFLRYLVTIQKDGKYLCLLTDKIKRAISEKKRVPRDQKKKKMRKIKPKTLCPKNPSNPEGEQWLIAEKTLGWMCGLHASFTEYRNCIRQDPELKAVRERHLHYSILLRHPVLRYLSEYLHVQRNATWVSPHLCGGRPVSEKDMPPCYPEYLNHAPWPNLTLSSFVGCESNWANNRQTLILADLESVQCFNREAMSKSEREKKLLETAKRNLESFSFFGLTEYMSTTYSLFEKRFGVKFPMQPRSRGLTDFHSVPLFVNLWKNSKLFDAVLQANRLDVQLYEYALELFVQRSQVMGIAVEKDSIENELDMLKKNPQLLKKTLEKFYKLNYTVS